MLQQVRDELQKSKSKNPKSAQLAKPKIKTKANEAGNGTEDSGIESTSPVKKRKRKPRRYPSTTRVKSDSNNGGSGGAS